MEDDLYKLQHNVYQELREISNPTGDLLRNNAKLFSRAFSEEPIPDFWQYLENYVWFKDPARREQLKHEVVFEQGLCLLSKLGKASWNYCQLQLVSFFMLHTAQPTVQYSA